MRLVEATPGHGGVTKSNLEVSLKSKSYDAEIGRLLSTGLSGEKLLIELSPAGSYQA